MKISKKMVVTAVALILSLSNASFAKELTKSNVAVIDVNKIVASSPEINALKTDRKNKVNDLVSYVENARAEISKEGNATKKKALEESYTKEINNRKETLDKEYMQTLSNVDKEISAIIKTKSAGYDFVFTKGCILEGGTDITNEIIKELK